MQCKALNDTIVTITDMVFFPSLHQNIKMLLDNRYKFIKISERHGSAFGPVFILGDNTPELPLREELGDLCENVCSNVHFCSDCELVTKVFISRFG